MTPFPDGLTLAGEVDTFAEGLTAAVGLTVVAGFVVLGLTVVVTFPPVNLQAVNRESTRTNTHSTIMSLFISSS
jgi:hypothetical protein